MGQNKIKILVACHKPCELKYDEVYTPIHVGRAVSKCTNGMSWMIGDDTGNNISDKNPYYCELTAQYWAWKNLTNIDYIGLCHYRRYFQIKLTDNNIDSILGDKFDVILNKSYIRPSNVGRHLMECTTKEDFYIFLACIKIISPEIYEDAIDYLTQNVVIGYNMFVMKRDDFGKFAEWQFAVLSEMEKWVKVSNYTRMKRIYGYFGEALLPIYCKANRMKICYSHIVPMLGMPYHNSIIHTLGNLRSNLFFHSKKREKFGEEAVINGLKQDFPDTKLVYNLPKSNNTIIR